MTVEEHIIYNFRSRHNPLLDKANRTIQQYTFDDVIEFCESYTNQQIEDLELLIELNEDDFDRGKGKYILREWIKKNRTEF